MEEERGGELEQERGGELEQERGGERHSTVIIYLIQMDVTV